MAVTLKQSKTLNSALTAFCFLFVVSLHAHEKLEIRLKPTVETHKKNLCLAELLLSHNLNPRDAQKVEKYCRIDFKGKETLLTAKDVELHAWAAGILPDRIIGGPVTLIRATSLQLPKPEVSESAQKEILRRGSKIQLVLKSPHMQIAREAHLMRDAFVGDTIEVRPHGVRRILKAKILSPSVAELVP